MARVANVSTRVRVSLFGSHVRTFFTIMLSIVILAALTITIQQVWRIQTTDVSEQSAAVPAPDPEKVFVQRQRVAFLGDSYAAGIGTDSASKAYVMIAARELDWTGRQFTVGGSGFSGPPTASYADRLNEVIDYNPTHVVVSGSRNDSEADVGVVEDQAEMVFQRIRDELPEAKLIVVGPIWTDGNPPPEIVRVNNEVRSAAEKSDALFINALQPSWLDGSPELLDADGVHPSPAGHELLAEQLVEELRKAGIE